MPHVTRRILFVAAGLLSAAGACETVNSTSVKTSGMHGDFAATGRADGTTHVTAALQVNGSLTKNYVKLAEGDSLSTKWADKVVPLVLSSNKLLGYVGYAADIPTNAEDQAVLVQFSRATAVSALASTVTLPAPFSITAPVANTQVTRGAGFEVHWDVFGRTDAMDITISGACIQPIIQQNVPTDNGTFFVPPAVLGVPPASQASPSCALDVTLRRVRNGTLDPAFGSGGKFQGIQERTVTLVLIP